MFFAGVRIRRTIRQGTNPAEFPHEAWPATGASPGWRVELQADLRLYERPLSSAALEWRGLISCV